MNDVDFEVRSLYLKMTIRNAYWYSVENNYFKQINSMDARKLSNWPKLSS